MSAFRVAIVGAGFGGIAAAVTLLRRGFDVTIFEKSHGVGGTWWDNRYPGAATDAASHIYSYTFAPHDWDRTHVDHGALRQYLAGVVERFGLAPRIRLGTAVRSIEWDAARQVWTVTPEGGVPEAFNAVVSAVGLFSKPRWPTWPGLGDFRGEVVHTAAWRPDVSLKGRRVAVVGTGSSAAQVVPAIVPEVASLTLFQRQPGWLLPKGDRPFTARERALLRVGPLRRLYRLKLYLAQELREWNGRFFKPGSKPNETARRAALAYLGEVFADRPDLKAALTPDYAFAGKRTVVSSDFFPALRDPKVTVVPRAVKAATPEGLVDAAGETHPADVVVLCTGYEATEYLSTLHVVGRDGRTLREAWAGEPSAFLGLMMPGFPNFFMLYGPNTNGGFIIDNLERQSAFVARELARLRRRGEPVVEVTVDAHRRYNQWLETRMAGTAFADGQNYFKTASGKIVTQWPDNATQYAARLLWVQATWPWRRDAATRTAPEPTHAPAAETARR